jgi:phosphomannomutase
MNISFESPYYNFITYEKIKTIEIYDKFLNWIQGEFDLYQMEELDGLKVYFPNGWFSITISSKRELDLKIVIKIKSKTLSSGIKIESQIKNRYSHLNQVYENKGTNV